MQSYRVSLGQFRPVFPGITIMATTLSDSIANETAGLDPRRQAILHELVETASTAASRQLEGFSTRLSEAMLRTAQSTSNPAEARLAANASALLKKNRYPFCFVAGERISAALQREVATLAGKFGSVQNRLQYTQSNIEVYTQNVSAANAAIKDVNMAEAMANFTKEQVLQQAGVAILAQANALPQAVLKLVSG